MLSEIETSTAVSNNGESSRRGILFVVSSPSGGGKGTLIQRALRLVPNVSYSVSYTTRNSRPGEVNGREYFFIEKDEFERMIAQNQFLEWAVVHNNLYGTASDQVSREMVAGRDIVLEVDVQGAASVRRLIADSVSIFILPPSFEVLKQRLTARGTDSPEELELRLRNAAHELKDYTAFDYVIINDDAERAAGQLSSIIHAERARLARQQPLVQSVVKAFVKNDEGN